MGTTVSDMLLNAFRISGHLHWKVSCFTFLFHECINSCPSWDITAGWGHISTLHICWLHLNHARTRMLWTESIPTAHVIAFRVFHRAQSYAMSVWFTWIQWAKLLIRCMISLVLHTWDMFRYMRLAEFLYVRGWKQDIWPSLDQLFRCRRR